MWICQLGGLKTILERALKEQLEVNVPQILSLLQHISVVYSVQDQRLNGEDLKGRRAQLIRDISYQVKRIDGINTVYRAVLK